MELVAQRATPLACEEVIVRAIQYFSTTNWRPTSQSARVATFQGKPPIPWFMLLLTILGFMACLIPGVIMYFMVIGKLYRFQNLVVTANPVSDGSQVIVQYPNYAATLASHFLEGLPLRRVGDQSTPADPAGASQAVSQFCINCGEKLEAGSRSCKICAAQQ